MHSVNHADVKAKAITERQNIFLHYIMNDEYEAMCWQLARTYILECQEFNP